MKKVSKLLFLSPLIASFLAFIPNKNAQQSNAYFYKNTEFSDNFNGNKLNDYWKTSESAELVTDYASLQVKPEKYDWGGQIVLTDYKIEGSVSITYDFESLSNISWFAFSYGNPNKAAAFPDAQAAFIFCNDLTQYFNHVDKEILNDTSESYPFSPIKAVGSERCYVNVRMEDNHDGWYNTTLSILDRAERLVHQQTNIKFPNIEGYIGFNSNFSSAEIYSIKIDDLSGNELYYEDFYNSGCSYSTKSEVGAKWATNTFTEQELTIGKKNKLAISKVDDYATYISPFKLPDNKDVDLLYTLKSTIYIGSQDNGIDTGFEIGKNSIDSKGYFIGARRNTFGFSLVTYDKDSTTENVLSTTNERADLCVDFEIDVYRTGKVAITANELVTTIDLKKIDGYFGFATRKHTTSIGSNGGRICNFEYSASKYRQRADEDMGQNFNGLISTVENDFTYYDFYYNKEVWYTGENVKLSMYKSQMKGNGYIAFSNSSPFSAIGPRTKFAEAIVRFDVEFVSSMFKNGECFGLQFAKQNVGTIFQNCPSLGFYMLPDDENPTGFASKFYATNCQMIPGYDEYIRDSEGKNVNLFTEGSRYTFLYVIKNNEISLAYKSAEQDESELMYPKFKVRYENTDGYIAVYGANGMTFNADNISIVNLDYEAPANKASVIDGYQSTTRYDFATGTDFDGLVFDNASVNKGALALKENGSLSTKGKIGSNIVRFKTKNVEDTLRVKRGNLTVDLVSGKDNKIIVSDGINSFTKSLGNDFSFAGASFEIENFGTYIRVSYVSGADSFSSIFKNSFEVTIAPDNEYLALTITSINGIASLENFAIFNLDSRVEILTVNFDPDKDTTNPWPERPSIDDKEGSKGCKSSVVVASGIVSILSLIGISLLLIKKNKSLMEVK